MVVVVALTRGGGPTAEFEQAAEQFHSRYEPLADAVEAGRVLMVNPAGFFSKGPMESILDDLRPRTEAVTAEREQALRQALGGS
ncbi:hypothetical protein O7621_24095 [Solwaraspora sp. WMMD937]|uniref:hypothetical protein n=1 Tax=Solwaraspora sp. WMMD937 TaxID=3016090 RepID=UPI00249B1459|nr:hypothetical protein [Solwaraspora sp. WMMD937]WFE20917.1 hypothetical protein O7621_24095 [Solwaraspora sp. WMMD937]